MTPEAYKTSDGYSGLPGDFQTIVHPHNKSMFVAAEVAIPTKDWTLDDLPTRAQELTQDKADDGATELRGLWAEAFNQDALRVCDPVPTRGQRRRGGGQNQIHLPDSRLFGKDYDEVVRISGEGSGQWLRFVTLPTMVPFRP